jgi:hypothetical protein
MKGDGFIGRLGNRVGSGARALVSGAGKAEGSASFEALEPRVLLAGDGIAMVDAPGLDDVFPPGGGTGAVPTLMDIAPTSSAPGLMAGSLDSGDTDDVFRFTAPQNGFISVLAFESTSTLNTQVEVFLPDGTELTGDNEGFSNGNLGRGPASDGWYGFVAEAGQEYYIRVVGENAGDFDPSSPADYTLQVNAVNTALTLTDGVARTGSDAVDSFERITSLQQDQLFTFTTGSEASLGYVLAGDVVFGDTDEGYIAGDPSAIDRDLFDARVEIYDANGDLVAANSDGGYLYDAFALARFDANSQYFVRVRSDAPTQVNIVDPQTGLLDNVAIGEFELRIQTLATNIDIDPDTRLTEVDRRSGAIAVEDGVTDLGDPDPAGLLRDQHSAQIFAFDSLTAGHDVRELHRVRRAAVRRRRR